MLQLDMFDGLLVNPEPFFLACVMRGCSCVSYMRVIARVLADDDVLVEALAKEVIRNWDRNPVFQRKIDL